MNHSTADSTREFECFDGRQTVVLTGGKILVEPSAAEQTTALAIAGGQVRALAADARALLTADLPAITHIDLAGRAVIPGLIDAHAHLVDVAGHRLNLALDDACSPAEVVERVQAALCTHSPTRPLIGEGWDESAWPAGSALRGTDLDRLETSIPIVLRRVCGHKAVANRAAVAAVLAHSPELDNPAAIERETGTLLEFAAMRTRQVFPPAAADLAGSLRAACNEAAALGITCLHEIHNQATLELLVEEIGRGSLPLRIVFHICGANRLPARQAADRHAAIDPRLTLGGVKLYLDGSIGARTAAISVPYVGEPTNRGQLLMNDADLRAAVHEIDRAGLQVIMHAIGDRAVAQAIDALESLGNAAVTAGRHRLEHVEVLPTPLLSRLAELGATVCMQPNFIHRWQQAGGLYEQRLGLAPLAAMNRCRSILAHDIPLAFGSDCMPLGPLIGLAGAVGHPTESERLTPAQAVAAYTAGAAQAAVGSATLGTLGVGRPADLVILDRDPLTGDSPATLDILATVVGGQLTHARLPSGGN